VLVGVAVAPPGKVGVAVGGLPAAKEALGTRVPMLINNETTIGRASHWDKRLSWECFGVNMIVISLI